MCVIIVAEDQKKNPLTKTDITEAMTYNPDGFGFAARYADGTIKIGKGFTEGYALALLEQHKDAKDHVFHARIATSGERDVLNCHPFQAHSDQGQRWLFHNGILSGIPMPNPRYCDTWHLAQTLRRYRTTENLAEYLEHYAKDQQSKFVTVEPWGVMIFNASQGVNRDGKWYSNRSAFPVPVTTSSSKWVPDHWCFDCQGLTQSPIGSWHNGHKLRRLTKRERKFMNRYGTRTLGDCIKSGTDIRKYAPEPAKGLDNVRAQLEAAEVESKLKLWVPPKEHDDPDFPGEAFQEWCADVAARKGTSVRDIDPDDLDALRAYRCG